MQLARSVCSSKDNPLTFLGLFLNFRVRPPATKRIGGPSPSAAPGGAFGRPKGAMPPFVIFSQERRPSVIKANPNATIPEIGKMLGEQWHALTEAEKNKYRQRAQAHAQALSNVRSKRGAASTLMNDH